MGEESGKSGGVDRRGCKKWARNCSEGVGRDVVAEDLPRIEFLDVNITQMFQYFFFGGEGEMVAVVGVPERFFAHDVAGKRERVFVPIGERKDAVKFI